MADDGWLEEAVYTSNEIKDARNIGFWIGALAGASGMLLLLLVVGVYFV